MALSCTDPVLDALLCAKNYMAAREKPPMPAWQKLVEDAIPIYRERHEVVMLALMAVKVGIETSSFDRYASAALEPSYRQVLAAIAKMEG